MDESLAYTHMNSWFTCTGSPTNFFKMGRQRQRDHNFSFSDQSISATGLTKSRDALVSPRCGENSWQLPAGSASPFESEEVDPVGMPIMQFYGYVIVHNNFK